MIICLCYYTIYYKKMSVTYQPKKRKRQRAHGFLKRTNSKSGRKIINQRRRKNRKNLAV